LFGVDTPAPRAGKPVALDVGDLGRLRTVAAAPNGSLWLSSSNTDGRGDPARTDDRMYQLQVIN